MTYLYSSGHFVQFLAKKNIFSKLAVGVSKHRFSIQFLTFDVISSNIIMSKLTSHSSPVMSGGFAHMKFCVQIWTVHMHLPSK